MPVTLDGGMALLHTAASAIALAWALMRSGVSSITPCGGRTMPAHTGSAAWHMLQRPMTISSTWANDTVGAAAGSARLPPGVDAPEG